MNDLERLVAVEEIRALIATYTPGPPPMSDTAVGVSGTTMRVGGD